MLGAFRGELTPDRLQNGSIEPPARLEVRDAQVDVIDQAAQMKFHASLLRVIPGREEAQDRLTNMAPFSEGDPDRLKPSGMTVARTFTRP